MRRIHSSDSRRSSCLVCRLLLIALALFLNARVDAEPTPLPAEIPQTKSSVATLISWLLEAGHELREVPFKEVLVEATGKRLLAIDLKNETDQRVISHISGVLDAVMKRMNAPDSSIQAVPRINEVSSHFEELLREMLNTPGFSCEFPRTSEDRVQRSGYPDLRLVDLETKRVFYLDPKLYASGSRDSSFRTFYFEPKITTNKVREDAVHLLIGFEHEKENGGHWNFTRWDLVDLAHFKVRLKAEFQGATAIFTGRKRSWRRVPGRIPASTTRLPMPSPGMMVGR